jgi:hypothetical protein
MADERNRSSLQSAAAGLMIMAVAQAEELVSFCIPARRRVAAAARRIYVEAQERLPFADRPLAERDMLEERYRLEELLALGGSNFSYDDMFFDQMMHASLLRFHDDDDDDEQDDAHGGDTDSGVVSDESRATRRLVPSSQLSDRVGRRFRGGNRLACVELVRRKRVQILQRQRQLNEQERQKMLEFHNHHSQPFDDQRHLLIRRVVAGIGWAVHSLVFESGPENNVRRWGYNLDNNGKDLSLKDNDLASRGARSWATITPGDYIVKVEGHQSTSGLYLCHDIRLHLASGKEIRFESTHGAWQGPVFTFDLAPHETTMLRGLDFGMQQCNRLFQGVFVQRTSIHTPFCKRTLKFLPQQAQDTVTAIQLCVNRAGLSSDIGWNILEMLPPLDFC